MSKNRNLAQNLKSNLNRRFGPTKIQNRTEWAQKNKYYKSLYQSVGQAISARWALFHCSAAPDNDPSNSGQKRKKKGSEKSEQGAILVAALLGDVNLSISRCGTTLQQVQLQLQEANKNFPGVLQNEQDKLELANRNLECAQQDVNSAREHFNGAQEVTDRSLIFQARVRKDLQLAQEGYQKVRNEFPPGANYSRARGGLDCAPELFVAGRAEDAAVRNRKVVDQHVAVATQNLRLAKTSLALATLNITEAEYNVAHPNAAGILDSLKKGWCVRVSIVAAELEPVLLSALKTAAKVPRAFQGDHHDF